ncbi:MAG TPA: 1-acyl-sn-glycerol-3-phosphate acyltransferase [Sphingobacterium sp.]|jgi:1-acyl-sn-glycerol-3-phosphate acyltransferase|nr:1-acyl-sn-glycerol-3-phosphate acyltransferase [Sphingobacterium sp.]
MFYSLLRQFVRLGLRWYVPDLRTAELQLAAFTAPTIVVSNHPNSLFDALVLAVHAPVELRYLARGDIFKAPLVSIVLRSLFMLPIYKRGDDEEYAVKNDFTYDECIRELKEGKHILIFPEGRSLNLWTLQPLMNGGLTSLLERSYKADIPVQVQPYTIDYSSFRFVPKAVSLRALPPIDSTDHIEAGQVDAAAVIRELRQALKRAMSERPMVPQPSNEKGQQFWQLLAPLGRYSQRWFYRMWRDYIRKKTEGTIFFDSLLFSVLLLTYPLFVLLCSVLVAQLLGWWLGLFVFLFLPLTSYAMAKCHPIKVETDITTAKANAFVKPKDRE